TRPLLAITMVGAALPSAPGARVAVAGDMCIASCASARRVCLAEGKTALKACATACTGDADPATCKQTCRDALAQAKDACRSALDDCHANCPPPPPNPASCESACAGNARSCFGDVLDNGKACVQACRQGGGDLSACLRSCVDALHSGGAACVATLRTCLADCQGSTSGSCLDLKT